jgi:hypothetical protein
MFENQLRVALQQAKEGKDISREAGKVYGQTMFGQHATQFNLTM